MELLEPEDRARIRGFAINKFRGDVELLRPGVEAMERRLGIPCAGVIPFLRNLGLEEEDSVALEDRRTARPWRNSEDASPERPFRVGVVAVPHMANFTDFDALAAEPSVSLEFLRDPAEAKLADALVLPGSKQTLDDLEWLRDRGFAQFLESYSGMLIGICGGFQMLGLTVEDPAGVESGGLARNMPALGRLAVRTIMRGEKTVRRAAGRARMWGATPFGGYEIHMGETRYESGAEPFAEIRREGEPQSTPDGAIDSSGRVWGTYIHGLFDDDAFRHNFLNSARRRCGLAPAGSLACVTAERQGRIDRWAAHLRQALDMNLIHGWIGENPRDNL
jgi:adenosylcobyric acid synthase